MIDRIDQPGISMTTLADTVSVSSYFDWIGTGFHRYNPQAFFLRVTVDAASSQTCHRPESSLKRPLGTGSQHVAFPEGKATSRAQ